MMARASVLAVMATVIYEVTAQGNIPATDINTVTLLHTSVTQLTGIADRLVEVESTAKKMASKLTVIDNNINGKDNERIRDKEDNKRQLGIIFSKLTQLEFELGGLQQGVEGLKNDLDFMRKGYSGVFDLVSNAVNGDMSSACGDGAGGRSSTFPGNTRVLTATIQQLSKAIATQKTTIGSMQSSLVSVNRKLETVVSGRRPVNHRQEEDSEDILEGIKGLQNDITELGSVIEGIKINLQNNMNERRYPRDCYHIHQGFNNNSSGGQLKSGLYKIQPNPVGKPFFVTCDMELKSGGWTVIQQRNEGAIMFHSRSFMEYRQGFGNLASEFWIGLDNIHDLTEGSDEVQELRIELTDFSHKMTYSSYSMFGVGDRRKEFAISILGQYAGTAGDSLTPSQGQPFKTQLLNDSRQCNQIGEGVGGWWFNSNNCTSNTANLNGRYYSPDFNADMAGMGTYWNSFHGPQYSLARTRMMIRPANPS